MGCKQVHDGWGDPIACVLQEGHSGMHSDGNGTSWRPPMQYDERWFALAERYVKANEQIARCQVRQLELAEAAQRMNEEYLAVKREEAAATQAGMAAVVADVTRKGTAQ